MTKPRIALSAAITSVSIVAALVGCDYRPAGTAGPDTGYSENTDANQDMVIRSATRLPEGITGKPGAGIEVDYHMPKTIQPGEVVNVEITFTPPSITGSLHVELETENVTLISTENTFDFTLGTGKELKAEASVYSGTAIRAYLNLFMTLKNEAGLQTSQAVAIPVQFGEVASGKSLQNEVGSDNQELHILSAEETVVTPEN